MLRIATGDNITSAIEAARIILLTEGEVVATEKWQGIKAPKDFWEFRNIILHAQMPNTRLKAVNQIMPNLPWADEHFKERIGEIPLNPGKSYLTWPFYARDSSHRKEDEKFSHTYMERFWPKFAFSEHPMYLKYHTPQRGIRYAYGDFNDVINLLIKEPTTRQAYLPIWFPEDTGVLHGGRVPCTLGYLFTIRKNILHCTYHIRSCDFLRHFRDDIYLITLLCQHLIEKLNAAWETQLQKPEELKIGELTMHISNLHIFDIEINKINK